MSDEQLIVRHVSFCDCGKQAGHIGVCRISENDPESIRVSADIENTFAERRAERFAKRARGFDAERRDRRGRTDTLTLHREAMQRAVRLTTVKAGNTEPTRGGESDMSGPPRQQSLTDDPRWEDATRIIRRRVMQLLDLLDEAEGTGRVAAVAMLTGPDKDRILVDEGRGLIAEMVVVELGPEYGSASYVRKLRRERGLDNRGYPKETDR